MTAHLSIARLPFAPLDNPRLQHLASAKNRQNGALAPQPATTAHFCLNTCPSVTSNKRAHEPSTLDRFDCENVDPARLLSPPKKTKSNAYDKPSTFACSIITSAMAKSMPPPSAFSPSPRTPLRTNISSVRAPSTAPAGRSPKRKLAARNPTRRTSAPFRRVDPPSFVSAAALPFSLDAVLNGPPPSSSPESKSEGATIAESMPKNWFFEIYRDTPEEEASNIMEHSTRTLDLSSDDEDEKVGGYRGKENTPPEGYDAQRASRSSSPVAPIPTAVSKRDLVRKKMVRDEMDEGSRSPLSDLETETFLPDGLRTDSCVIVDELAETFASDGSELFPKPGEAVGEAAEEASDPPVVHSKGDVNVEINVWEDEEVSA